MRKITIISIIISLAFTTTCMAHPGRTDKNGGHVDKSTGEYHYHYPNKSETVESKSQEPGNQPEKKDEENAPLSPEPTTDSLNKITNIIVDGDKKSVTEPVSEIIKEEAKDIPVQADEPVKVIDENGDTIIYIPRTAPYHGLNTFAWYLLILFATIGLMAVSPFVCVLLNKIESKNEAWSIILHVPYLIFWLPSLPGKLLYKFYANIAPKDSSDEEYDDDDYYDEI